MRTPDHVPYPTQGSGGRQPSLPSRQLASQPDQMMATELVDPFAPTIAASAIVSLVFALLGLNLLPVLGQLVSIIAGHRALARIKRSDGAVQGRGLALAGLWVSYIALALGALALCAFAGGLFELQRSLTQP